MFKVYTNNELNKWNEIVKSFDNWDIYYLYEYAYSFMLHGDGDPLLFHYKNGDFELCYVVLKKDIAEDNKFKGLIKNKKYYDLETPYGYGGVLVKGKITNAVEDDFKTELFNYTKENNIITQFVRFHPLLENYKYFNNVFETRYMRDTIYIDTSDEETIISNMDTKNRNMVRKARKNEVEIEITDIGDFEDFIDIYNETMGYNNADDYYTFKRDYFESLKTLGDNAKIFYARKDGERISGAIMLYNDKFLHYHLSGTHYEYRKYSPGNLLLFESAKWASVRGITKMHLGGGMSPDDSLFMFKKQFNKNGKIPFYIGRTIFDKEVYDELLSIREKQDDTFDINNGFLIQYRR